MSRYIINIFGVGLLDTISTKESRMKEISKNIAQYQQYIVDILIIYRYIGHNIGYKCSTWNKTQNFTILANISADIDNLSSIYWPKNEILWQKWGIRYGILNK